MGAFSFRIHQEGAASQVILVFSWSPTSGTLPLSTTRMSPAGGS